MFPSCLWGQFIHTLSASLANSRRKARGAEEEGAGKEAPTGGREAEAARGGEEQEESRREADGVGGEGSKGEGTFRGARGRALLRLAFQERAPN